MAFSARVPMHAVVGVTSTSERGELGVGGMSFVASAFSGGADWLAAAVPQL
jgi:hypothetical protein